MGVGNNERVGGLQADAEIDTGKFDAGIAKMAGAVDKLDPSMRRAEQSLRRTEDAAAGAGKGAEGAGVSFQKLAAAMGLANVASQAVFAALQKVKQAAEFALTAPLANARSFESAMVKVGTVTRQTQEETAALGKQVLELTKVIPKTKEDLGAGLYQIVQSGIEGAADAMKVLEVSARAAVGGVTEVSTAATVLTNTINAYGLSANDAAHIADVMFVGARMGTAEFEDLATSMGTVNATAALLGVSVNEVVAGIESMSLAGISAEEASTALNRLLLSVVNPSKEVTEAVKEIQKQFQGFEFSADALKQKGLQGFMKDLAEVVGDNTELMVTLTGDVRAFKAAAVIAGEGAENFAKILAATKAETGALDEAFIRNADTLDNLLVVAWNTFIATLTEAGQQHLPEVKDAVRELIQALDDNKDSIIGAAIALSQNLVGAIQAVVDNAPGIIDALGKIAAAASATASAISTTLSWASGLGEYVGALGDTTGDTMRAVRDAHAQGKLYRTVVGEEAGKLRGAADLSQKNAAALDRAQTRRRQMDQVRSGQVPVADKDMVLREMAKGKTLEDVQAQLLRGTEIHPPPRPKTGGGYQGDPTGGGGGDKVSKEEREALAQAKHDLSEIEKLQKDIAQVMNEQTKANRERVDRLRDELMLKQRLGVITHDEERTLEKINRRAEYAEDLVKEATDAWEKADARVKKLKDTVQDLNEEIKKTRKELDDTLKGIDDDLAKKLGEIGKSAQEKRVEKAADLLRERKELEAKIEGTTGDEQALAQRRRAEIDAQLAPFKGTDEGQKFLAEAESRAGMNDFQLIDLEEQQKTQAAKDEAEAARRAAALEYNGKLEEQLGRLNDATNDLAGAERARDDASQKVIQTLKDMAETTANTYAALETATAQHVAKQITQVDMLKAHLDALSASYNSVGSLVADPKGTGVPAGGDAPGFAGGGGVFGEGTDTSDNIIARLSPGEHVLTAREVRAAGGHAAIYELRRLLLRGFSLPRFAAGGAVNHNENYSRNANITNNYYGDAARVMSRLSWYDVRAAMR